MAKSVTYFTSEGFQRGFVKTNGEAASQKDVNDNLESAGPQQRNYQGKKVNAVKLQWTRKKNHKVHQQGLYTENVCLALCQTGKGLQMQETSPSAEPKTAGKQL